MTPRAVSVSIGLVCIAGVSIAAWWGFSRHASPGPLHPSHDGVAALRGSAGCRACHAGGGNAGGSLSAACIACHEPIGAQTREGSGLHGRLDAGLVERCEACHHEHLGADAPLVSPVAFAAAGIDDVSAYDHADVEGFALEGRHDELACTQCHEHAERASLVRGQQRYLGLTQACDACHDDVHRGELGSGCADCHGQERPFAESPLFTHPETFPLQDGHASRLCSECHTTPNVFTGAPTACVDCHTPDYEGTTAPSHRVAGLGTACAECHTTTSWEEAEFTHPDAFRLVGAHADSACVACHTTGSAQAGVVAHTETGSCAACHTSPHDPAFVGKAGVLARAVVDACVVCHVPDDTTWREGVARVTPELHAGSGFPLDPPHDARTCVDCHPGLGDAPTRFDPPTALAPALDVSWADRFPGRPPEACERCHDDPHGGQFASDPTGGACIRCHSVRGFYPTTFDAARHAGCAFPLEGAHRGVACVLCHTIENDGVRRFVGTPGACAACHDDPHGGSFDAPSLPASVAGRAGCARCHTPAAFDEVGWSASDHLVWTGEALTGRHAEASCNACHRRAGGRPAPSAPFAPAPRACAACHEDPHAGQFWVDGATDCARCHRSTESFGVLAFDHQTDSRFPLDDDHARLDCVACHRAVRVGEFDVVRYRPLGVTCADCHGSRTVQPEAGGRSP